MSTGRTTSTLGVHSLIPVLSEGQFCAGVNESGAELGAAAENRAQPLKEQMGAKGDVCC